MELLGKTIHGIRVVDVLGQGGMGEVYVGFHEKLQRRVALKRIRPDVALDTKVKGRFLQEARILSRLQHPHICQVFDFIETEFGDLIVLELIEGKTLTESISDDGLTENQKLDIAEQIAQVLVAAHGQAVVHRDLKPANVMLTSGNCVKVLDFGLARSVAMDEEETLVLSQLASAAAETVDWLPSDSILRHTGVGMLVGTPTYMSPEQARGDPATPASDMYSFGLLLQELFSGEPCYDTRDRGPVFLKQVADAKTRPVEGLTAELTRLIRALKQPDPTARPSSDQAAQALRLARETPRSGRILGGLVFGVLGMVAVYIYTAWMQVSMSYLLAEAFGEWFALLSLVVPLLCPPVVAAIVIVVRRRIRLFTRIDPFRWIRGFSLLYIGGYMTVTISALAGHVFGNATVPYSALVLITTSSLIAVIGCLLALQVAKGEMKRTAGSGRK